MSYGTRIMLRELFGLPSVSQRTRPCPCGCGERVGFGQVACRAGWRRLPEPYRAAVRTAAAERQARGDESTKVALRRARSRARRWLREHPGGAS